ncbi:ABC transporter ATP-binding protein [Streptococcus salivarius]|uniref:ABC transporter ATP-binding protein n=1 Tax=Streptococcus salivarius TaxID=1304 RepID=UPI00397897AD
MDVKCKDIYYSIGDKKILNGVSLKVEGGQFQTILGPNGSGKSTLLKTIYRQLKPDSGQILLDGKSLDQVSLKETAKEMAVVTQFNPLQFDCTVEEIVMLGRTPHLSFLQKESERDLLLVQDALDKVGMSEKKTRYYSSLSGGEKQRVILARALAQEPKLLLLDEPTNHLDIKYQLEMLALVKKLGINVLAVLHDIQLACRFSDYIYLMKGGEIVAQGVPRDAVTPQSLQAVYDVQSRITWTDDQQAMIQYL